MPPRLGKGDGWVGCRRESSVKGHADPSASSRGMTIGWGSIWSGTKSKSYRLIRSLKIMRISPASHRAGRCRRVVLHQRRRKVKGVPFHFLFGEALRIETLRVLANTREAWCAPYIYVNDDRRTARYDDISLCALSSSGRPPWGRSSRTAGRGGAPHRSPVSCIQTGERFNAPAAPHRPARNRTPAVPLPANQDARRAR